MSGVQKYPVTVCVCDCYPMQNFDSSTELRLCNKSKLNFMKLQMKTASKKKITFHSNLLGGFGAGFVTPLNTIDFNSLFDNFGQKVLDSACVWGTILAIIIIYIPFAVLCRRLDKKDSLKV